MRLLVVEDDAKLAGLLVRGLTARGHRVATAARGDDAVGAACCGEYDAIVLDLMLPGIDGLEALRRMRDAGVWAPVLVLTARDAVPDRVAGLDGGADDYLVKPFAFNELDARLRAVARRAPGPRPVVLEGAGLRLDPAERRVRRGDTEIELSAQEFAVLEALLRARGRVLSRDQLLDAAWDPAAAASSNVVDVAIMRVRERIDRPFATDSIETVRGAGYRLRR